MHRYAPERGQQRQPVFQYELHCCSCSISFSRQRRASISASGQQAGAEPGWGVGAHYRSNCTIFAIAARDCKFEISHYARQERVLLFVGLPPALVSCLISTTSCRKWGGSGAGSKNSVTLALLSPCAMEFCTNDQDCSGGWHRASGNLK